MRQERGLFWPQLYLRSSMQTPAHAALFNQKNYVAGSIAKSYSKHLRMIFYSSDSFFGGQAAVGSRDPGRA
jgi:hypothetical protein